MKVTFRFGRCSDTQLKQHCVAAVLDELKQADDRVKEVVAALHQAVKVVQASRELDQSLVLNGSEQVKAAFRHLGESCNQIGPLLRLLHHNMGAIQAAAPVSVAVTAASVPVAPVPTAPVARPQPKPTLGVSDESSSDSDFVPVEVDDEERAMVGSTQLESSEKRKAATLDLSTQATKRRKIKGLPEELEGGVWMIAHIEKGVYTVTDHNELASFVKKVLARKQCGRVATTGRPHVWSPAERNEETHECFQGQCCTESPTESEG